MGQNDLNRRSFFRKTMSKLALLSLGTIAGRSLGGSRKEATVWQLDPNTCTSCGRCATECVLDPSAVKCVQDYPMCGYCKLCFGYFTPEAPSLTSGAENQICPTGAIERLFVEDPYWEYNILEDRCIGCAKCVLPCEVFGNASFYLQVRHNICVNCNDCAIARVCPSDSYKRVPANNPYLLKGGFKKPAETV